MKSWAQKYKATLIPFGYLLLTCVVFGASLQFDFLTWDDNELLTDHPLFQQLTWRNIISFWNPWLLRTGVLLDYSPVRDMSYVIDRTLFGWKAWGFHGVQLLLHSTNAYLLFRILSRRISETSAWLVALLWMVHPLCVEPVVWISSRKDLLFVFFFLLAWQAHECQRNKSTLGYGLGALLSKYTAIVLGPFLFLRQRRERKKNLYAPLLLTLVAVLLGAFAMWANQQRDTLVSLSDAPSALHAWPAAFQAVSHFFEKSLYPVSLSARYVQHPEWTWMHPRVLLGAALTVGLVVGAFKHESLLLLLLGLVPSFIQMTVGHPIWMADRYAYLSLIGFLWFVVEMGARYFRPYVVVGMVLALVLSVTSAVRVQTWKNPLTLWKDTVVKSPEFYLNQGNAGIAYMNAGNVPSAVSSLERALKINPSWTKGYLYLADTYLQLGEPARAKDLVQQSEKLERPQVNDEVYRAILFGRLGDQEKAGGLFKNLLVRQPNNPYVLGNAGIFYVMNRQPEKAMELWQQAVAVSPYDAMARVNRGIYYFMAKQCDRALEELSLAGRPSIEENKKIAWLREQCQQKQ